MGGTHGDGGRNFTAQVSIDGGYVTDASGIAARTFYVSGSFGGEGLINYWGFTLNASRQSPIANKFQGRAWGSLACVYLGMPAS